MSNDIIGQRYGMLVVQSEASPIKDARGHLVRRYNCLCDCGNEKVVRQGNLIRTNSCGCTRFPKKPPVDLTGMRFHHLTVLSEAEPLIQKDGKKLRRWNCLCDCGNETTVLQSNLLGSNGTKSCGCIVGKHKGYSLRPPANLAGNRYGKLTVLAAADPVTHRNHSVHRRWLCRCECGNEVVKTEYNLVSGHTRSCGCLKAHSIKGSKIGMLTILSRAPSNTSMRYWNCKCECGNEIVVSQADLDWGTVTNCGCAQQGKQRVDLTGQTFGRLTPLREVAPILSAKGKPERAWLCRCECGREVVVRQGNLTKKVTRSCGCLRSKKQIQRFMKEEAQP